MSESTFPFAGAQEQAAYAADELDSGPDKRLLAGGLVAALLLGVGGFFLLGGGGGEEEEDYSVAVRTPAAQAEAAAPVPVAVVPAAATETVGRNPFKPRYVEPKEVASPPPTTTTTTTTGTSAVGGKAPAAGAPAVPAEYPLTVLTVSDPQPEARVTTVEYEGGTHDVLPGQRFGKYGELVVLAFATEDGGATVSGVVIQVGDASPFTVRLGETVKVL